MPRPRSADIREGLRVTVVGSVINVALVALKLTLGVLGHSRALFADGLHSLSDLVSDLIVIGGMLVGSRPRDESHHYGHGKVEVLAEMTLGGVLVIAGLGIVLDSVRAVLKGSMEAPLAVVLPAALLSVVLKEWLYRVTMQVARRSDRPVLVANAWHHRSDALTSVGVLLGAGLAILFPAMAMVDALVGLLVAAVVIKVGGGIAWEAAMSLIDTAPSRDYMSRVTDMIRSVPGVRSVRNLRMRHVGRLIAIEVHLGLDPEISVREGHDVATDVKRYVLERDRRVFDVLVHMEPEEDSVNGGQ
ncbi:MAG: cation transporter [bacterium]|nr:MAG: cation transporter [bacterium]